MKRFGLSPGTLDCLRNIFIHYPAVESVRLYGSRAKGTSHERSDIDLAVFGQGIDRFIVASLMHDIDDSEIPYLVDIQDFATLRNPGLIDHIQRVGQEIYHRPETIAQAPLSTPRRTG